MSIAASLALGLGDGGRRSQSPLASEGFWFCGAWPDVASSCGQAQACAIHQRGNRRWSQSCPLAPDCTIWSGGLVLRWSPGGGRPTWELAALPFSVSADVRRAACNLVERGD